MGEEKSAQVSEAELLAHILFFAYQKVVHDLLGSDTATVFVHPFLDAVKKISDELGIELIKGKTVDEAFENYAKILQNTGLANEVRFEKLEPRKYILHIKCPRAKRVHATLKLQNSTCRWALVAMAILEKLSEKKANLTYSKFLEEGTETRIECLEESS